MQRRLREHNAGKVSATCEFLPWSVEVYLGFVDGRKAVEFERYLKSGSGREFARRRFR